jgi:hypothetical protein
MPQICIGQVLAINDYFGVLHFDAVRLPLLFRGQGTCSVVVLHIFRMKTSVLSPTWKGAVEGLVN